LRCVVFTGSGGNEVVELQDRPDPTPGSEDVVVRATHAGLNPADIQQRNGHYPAPPGSPADIPGLEVAGVVERSGERVTTWRPGDRVFGLVGGGGLADRVIVHERCLARVPDTLDDAHAAAAAEAFITAHDAVAVQAGLRPGETLLVHGAAGAVGSAAVQIGITTGARVLGVVRHDAGRELVTSLGATAIADDRFAAAALAATDGAGVDVILELVGAPHFPGNLDALAAKGGRIVIVGVGAGQEVALPLLRLMQKRAVLRGTVLRARALEEKASAVRAFEREVLPALARGAMMPIVDRVFAAADVAAAFDHLVAAGKLGKVLLQFA
jgi:NADPH:quinone reductase-like Zn-dependent oxidoreductase